MHVPVVQIVNDTVLKGFVISALITLCVTYHNVDVTFIVDL